MKSILHLAVVASILATQIFVAQGTRELYFDEGKYTLLWDLIPVEAPTTIQFFLTVETTGWVGLGISPNPNMADSDLFIGGVTDADSTPYHGDYYGIGNGMPTADAQNDWTVVSSSQSDTHTTLTISRLLVTGDAQDQDIPDARIYLLWAYGAADEIDYHMGKKGSELINLIDPTDVATTTEPAETTTVEAETTTVEAETTTVQAETTTVAAETTTVEAETTTVAAETTTVAAETTTVAAETTTVQAETTTVEAGTTVEAETTTVEAGTTTTEAGGSKILGSFSVLFIAAAIKLALEL